MKFKVGDKVRILDYDLFDNHVCISETSWREKEKEIQEISNICEEYYQLNDCWYVWPEKFLRLSFSLVKLPEELFEI